MSHTRVVARQLAEAGMTAYVGARREEAGRRAERELRASGSRRAARAAGPRRVRSVASAAELVERSSGRLDVLVNMVGLTSSLDGTLRIRRTASEWALPVRLALAEDSLLTATSTGPDGVCSGLSAQAPGGESGTGRVHVV
ncbi:SDR family NAD(P)-dependent oxidoreductase [Streptomyces sp. NPDC057428]|uniref:SDR family NAD(P)-dependent oxidoreductase n=1 Tax=Streptomyces sp. NPDC057428 TaxID=3346129 RepID=UPI00368B0B43